MSSNNPFPPCIWQNFLKWSDNFIDISNLSPFSEKWNTTNICRKLPKCSVVVKKAKDGINSLTLFTTVETRPRRLKKKNKPTQGHSRVSNTQRKQTPLWHPWFLKINRLTGTRSSLSVAFNSKVQPRTLSSEKRLWLMSLVRGGKPEGIMASDYHSVLVWVNKKRARGRVGFCQLFCILQEIRKVWTTPWGRYICKQTHVCIYIHTLPPILWNFTKAKENKIQTQWKTIAHLD